MCKIPRYLEGSYFKMGQGDKSVGKMLVWSVNRPMFDPQNLPKKLGMAAWTCNLSTGDSGTRGFGDLLVSQINEL